MLLKFWYKLMKILIVNGVNIGRIGSREKSIYGEQSYADMMNELSVFAKKRGAEVEVFQSDLEGELVERICNTDYDALVLNAGAYTHTSVAITDALRYVTLPKIEVHISNLFGREDYRKILTGGATDGVIAGFGINSYKLAIIKLTEEL